MNYPNTQTNTLAVSRFYHYVKSRGAKILYGVILIVFVVAVSSSLTTPSGAYVNPEGAKKSKTVDYKAVTAIYTDDAYIDGNARTRFHALVKKTN